MEDMVPVKRAALMAAMLHFLAGGIAGCSGQTPHPPSAVSDAEVALSVARVFPTEWQVDGQAIPLTPFNSVATDGAGHIYVAQPMSSDVLVLDANGGFVRVIGRSGDGPGEFRSPLRLGVTDEGAVWVHDSALRRVSLFSPDTGALLGTLRVPPAPLEIPTGLEPLGVSAQGAMIASEPLLPGRIFRGVTTVGQFGIDPDGNGLAWLGEYMTPDRVLALVLETRQGVAYRDPPVVTADAFGTLGRQVVSVAVPNRDMAGDSVLLILRSHAGDTLRVIRYLRNPIPIDDEFRRHHLELITGVGVRGQYFATESRSRQVVSELVRFPSNWPPAQELVRSYRSDEIWLRVADPLEGGKIYERVRLLPGENVQVQRIRVPEGVHLIWIAQEAPLGVFEDDMGQPYLVALAPS